MANVNVVPDLVGISADASLNSGHTYTAVATRDQGWWVIWIPGLGDDPHKDGLYTQAPCLTEIEPEARKLIGVWLGVPSTSFNVLLAVVLPDAVRPDVEICSVLRRETADIEGAACDPYQLAARRLSDLGLVVQDIAVILGIADHHVQNLTLPRTRLT